MKLGLIGYPLGHSWSPQIHAFFLGEECYSLMPLQKEELDAFFARKDFDGLNVTIPYKQDVIPYLDELDDSAAKIGAVNTIVNRNGKLTGYNTDYIGFRQMLAANGIDVVGKNVAVLGSGGVSKAIYHAVIDLQGKPWIVSRTPKENAITYEELYRSQASFEVIVNATPVGMSPHENEVPVDLSQFHHLRAVVDAIANPLQTRLLWQAKLAGYQTCGGFEMLVRQALAADEFFLDQKMDQSKIVPCMNALLKTRKNIVLIGMPTCGKTTIGKLLSEELQRPFVDMDAEIETSLGTTISQCFAEKGEAYFRSVEAEVAKSLSSAKGNVISTGGGIIKNAENMFYLSENGLVIWVDRDLEKLMATDDRPLSKDFAAVAKLYQERKELYALYSDLRITNNGELVEAVECIKEKIGV